jgi:2-iminobutanoate/2-iminopropanoate deaminase
VVAETAHFTPSELPPPTGYTHAVKARGLLFVSGQVGFDGERRLVRPGDIDAQTRQALDNIGRLLDASGATWKDVVKLNIYLCDMRHMDRVRAVRAELFTRLNMPPPAITTVGVTGLAAEGALIEIEAIAVAD